MRIEKPHITLKNPRAFPVGKFANGATIYAYQGEEVDTYLTFNSPVTVAVGIDENGELVTGILGKNAQKALIAYQRKPNPEKIKTVTTQKKGYWENAILILLGGAAESLPPENIISEVASGAPRNTSGKDRRKECARRAVNSLLKAGEIRLENGLIKINNDSDLIEE